MRSLLGASGWQYCLYSSCSMRSDRTDSDSSLGPCQRTHSARG
jgi:hypothetical protein